ncbi:hypothetical protein [Sphingomonas sp. ABOLD]|nr:hypothetical protein [Sphingomonas sp. ABOLD]
MRRKNHAAVPANLMLLPKRGYGAIIAWRKIPDALASEEGG